MATSIRMVSQKDLDAVIEVHNNAFEGFFLTNLGPRFLRLYYNSVLEAPDGILIGAYQNENLIGFCAACCKSAGFNSSLIRKNWFKFGICGIRLLLTCPMAIIRLIRNLRKTGITDDDGSYAELMSIAVNQDVQNSGAGKAMLDYLEKVLMQDDIELLSLTTDKLDNEKTLGFYSKRGFSELYTFTAYPNRLMYRLIKELKNHSEPVL